MRPSWQRGPGRNLNERKLTKYKEIILCGMTSSFLYKRCQKVSANAHALFLTAPRSPQPAPSGVRWA